MLCDNSQAADIVVSSRAGDASECAAPTESSADRQTIARVRVIRIGHTAQNRDQSVAGVTSCMLTPSRKFLLGPAAASRHYWSRYGGQRSLRTRSIADLPSLNQLLNH